MTKTIAPFIVCFLLAGCNTNTTKDSKTVFESDYDKYNFYFSEIETLLNRDNGRFWGINLYGPLLIVDAQTRKVYANEADSSGILNNEKGLFTGILPENISPSNTVITWNGKRWSMIMTPLPEGRHERNSLIVHELFHQIQPQLEMYNNEGGCPLVGNNNQLDEMEGRILLRLELSALKKALESEKNWETHMMNALIFRSRRYEIYPEAKANENFLEMNEGIAEYTGAIFGFEKNTELNKHLQKQLTEFVTNPTYVRSFAYVTIPVYGYFGLKTNNQWHRDVTNSSNLTDYFVEIFQVQIPDNLEREISVSRKTYNYSKIHEAEEVREEKKLAEIEAFKRKFTDETALVLNSYNLYITFDPRNVTPLEGFGTIYPTLTATDEWGILTTEKGGLISQNWDKVTVPSPTYVSDSIVSGDGWKLKLHNGWKVIKKGKKYLLNKE